MFFRELPEPLFTFNHFNDFVNAISKYVVALSFPPDVENPLYIWIKLLQFLWSYLKQVFFKESLYSRNFKCDHQVSLRITKYQVPKHPVTAFSFMQTLHSFFFFFFPRTRATTACLCCEGPDQTVAKAKSGHNADSVQTSQKVRVSRRERRSNWGKRRSEKCTDRLCGVGPPGPGDQTQVQSPAVLFCCSCNIRKIMSLSPSSL